jgi:hypothetical protein
VIGLLVGLLVLVGAVVGLHFSQSDGSPHPSSQLFEAVLGPVPRNHVTGSGTASVRVAGHVITVTIDARGLLNGEPHGLHLHAFGRGICPPASAAHLYNGHLAISTTDGAKYYGPMVTALTLNGDTGPGSMLAQSRYPSSGDIHYQRTLTVPSSVTTAIRTGNALVVVHGIDYNHNGVYDNGLDRSELDGALSQEETAPALCGTLVNAQSIGESG